MLFSQTTERPPQTTTTPAPPRAGPIYRCPVNEPASLVPSRVSCRLYYVCLSNGNYYQQDCGINRIFDHIHRNCTLPENGECWAETHPPEQNAAPTVLYDMRFDDKQMQSDDTVEVDY